MEKKIFNEHVAKMSNAQIIAQIKTLWEQEQRKNADLKKALKKTLSLLEKSVELIDLEKDDDEFTEEIEQHFKDIKNKKIL